MNDLKQRSRYLIKNTITFAIGNIGTKLISFFLIPLYTNILAASEYGTVDLVNTVGTVLVPILTLNIAESIMRFSLDKDADQNKIMSIGLTILLLSTVIGLGILPLCTLMMSVAPYARYVYWYTVTLAYSQVFLSYLRGKEMLLKYSIGNILHTLFIALFNILLLVVYHRGVEGFLTAYIIANTITALYAMLAGHAGRVFKHFQIDFKLFVKMAKYSIVLIPNSFMWWIMNSSDRLMVTAMIGAAANGIYAISYKIPTLLSTLSTIFNQAWSYSAIREDESKDKEEYSNIVYNRLVSLTIPSAVGLLMVMKPFLRVYVGANYYLAWRYTPYLMVGFVFMTLGTFLSTSYTVHKDSFGFLLSGMLGAAANIILNFILIPVTGVTGAAIATCVSYLCVYAFRVWHTRKYLKLKVFCKSHIMGYALLTAAAATMFLDTVLGQALLIVEFILVVILFRKHLAELFNGIWRKVKRRR